jgi:polyisoprenoid-binding protein YceI
MESEKYPFSTFKGKMNEKIDLTKDGEHKVTCTGKLEMHGVTQEVTIPGVLKIKNGEITLTSNFKVKLADYKIKVPSLYVKNIAEEIDVDVTAVLKALKKA